MRRLSWLAEPPALAATVLLPTAGGAVGWRLLHGHGAWMGALSGLLVAVALAAFIERG
jgi:hypothetical protein